MPAVSQKIPNLVGGVSQQPDSLKLPGQLVSCDDFLPDPTFGLAKRPGFKHIRQLEGAFAEGTWGWIDRDDDEKYIVQMGRTPSSTMVKVWDGQSGQAQNVEPIGPAAREYLTHSVDEDIELLTLGDFTLIVNRTVNVRGSELESPQDVPFAAVVINSVAYNTRYTVEIDGVGNYEYLTPSDPATRLSLEDLIEGLSTQINDGTMSSVIIGNYLYITRVDEDDFSISVTAGNSGSALEAFKGKVNTIAQLPRQFINNARMQVLAGDKAEGDDYWVVFKTDGDSNKGVGVWEETIAPGTKNGYDVDTMPHGLVRLPNGSWVCRALALIDASPEDATFTVEGVVTSATVVSGTRGRYLSGQSFYTEGGSGQGLRLRVEGTDANGAVTAVSIARAGRGYIVDDEVTNEVGDTFKVTAIKTATVDADQFLKIYWVDREVGDSKTNKFASFKGSSIDGIAFFQNRLILSSGSAVVASEAGNYFNFFRSTVSTILDSDPIDLSAGSERPIHFNYMVPRGDGLICFSDSDQYSLQTNTESFSSRTAELVAVSSFEMNNRIKPANLGQSFMVATQTINSSGLIEARFGENAEATRSLISDITRTIPNYIPPDLSRMEASSTSSMLALHSRQEPKSLFCFKFYDVPGVGRQQAAWFRWNLPGEILAHFFSNNTITCAIRSPEDPTVVVLMSCAIEQYGALGPLTFEGEPIDVRLDGFSYSAQVVYDPIANHTRVGFPQVYRFFPDLIPEVVTIETVNPGYILTGEMVYNPLLPPGQKYHMVLPGDYSGSRFATGFRYVPSATMPYFYVTSRQDRSAGELISSLKDTRNIPIVHRLNFSSRQGPYQVQVNSLGRAPFVATLEQKIAGSYIPNTLPLVRSGEPVVPVLAAGNQTEVTILAPFPFPVSIDAVTWEGTYNNQGVRAI